MRKVVHWVCFPFFAGAVVGSSYYTVYYWVAEMHVGTCHVNFGTEYHAPLLNLSAVHLLKQFKALLNRTVAVGTLCARLCGGALLLCYLLGALLVNVGLALFYEFYSEVPQLVKIVRCVVYISPVESQPFNVLHDCINIFHVFFCGVCVIEAQIAYSVVLLRHSEVHADGLCMTYVKIAVRFGREACLHFSSVLALFKVIYYNLLNKTDALLFALFSFVNFGHRCICLCL